MQTRKSISSIHSAANVATLLALAFSSLGVTPAYAANLIVTSSANNGPGTLRSAIAAAGTDDTITFDPSLSSATIYLATELTITKALTIDGSALASKITISGDSDGNGTGDVRVFSTSGSGVIKLNSLVITKGNGSGGTGGAINNSAWLYIFNSTLTGNSTTSSGGAIYTSTTRLTLLNTTLSGNTAGNSGGGIYNNGGLVYVIENSTVSGNNTQSGAGAGIYNGGASGYSYITNSTVSGNSAGNSGGGIYNSLGTVTVANSTISGNSSSNDGGGIYNYATLTITNSTIAANAANGSGGGIYNAPSGYANLYNTSIVFNGADADADQNGGLAGGVYSPGVFNMRNDLIAGNFVSGSPDYDDCGGTTIRSYGRDLIGAVNAPTSGGCTVVSVVGTWAQLNDLNLLGPLQNNGGPTKTVALLPGSNAIDGADPIYGCTDVNGAGIFVDQRGVVRPKGVRCDVGAYELAPDTDADGLADELDNCTLVANPTQLDADQDGYGNRCDGDLNNTGLVTAQDNVVLRNQLNQPASANPTAAAADLNGSGLVTAQDNVILRNQLNTAPGPSGYGCGQPAGSVACP